MESTEPELSRPEVEAAIDRIKTSSEFLQWDWEFNGKLYYALWILFMGGFVLSIQFSTRPDFYSPTMMKPALRLFRILAVVGSALNFAMQSMYLGAVRFSKQLSLKMGEALVSWDAKNEHAGRKGLQEMKKLGAKLRKLDRWISVLEYSLRICGALFLACALFITWNIFPVVQGK